MLLLRNTVSNRICVFGAKRFPSLQSLGLRKLTNSTKANAKVDVSVFEPIYTKLPVFRCDPKRISILAEPSDFYNSLLKGIAKAKKRIVLASLYIGSEQAELADSLRNALVKNRDLQVTVMIDYFRGTRPPSSVSLLSSLCKEFPDRMQLLLYKTPVLGSFLKSIIPSGYNEGFGLQHMKIYIFDDDLILGGANLQKDYFINRQDRYIEFKESTFLCDYYADLVKTVGQFSLCHGSDEKPILKGKNVTELLEKFTEKWTLTTTSVRSGFSDTLVIPAIQLGPHGIHQKTDMINEIFKVTDSPNSTNPWLIHVSSAYLNFPNSMIASIINSKAKFKVLTSSPEANCFFDSKGVARYLPVAYTFLEKTLLDKIIVAKREKDVTISEYKRDEWTFHAKGIWCTPPGEMEPILTMVGSSNFGHRSFSRDVEAQAVIITSNAGLRMKLHDNLKDLYKFFQRYEAVRFY